MINQDSKECRWCHQIKPLDQFDEHPQMADGHLNKCKVCLSAANRAAYKRNKEGIKAKALEYHHANRDKILKKKKRYYRQHREEHRAKTKAYAARPEVQERQRKYRREYYLANKSKFLKNCKAYRQSDRGRAVAKVAHAKEKQLHSQKLKARYTISNALANGHISRPSTCQRCGTVGAVEAHHHKGYERQHWLSVRWLCLGCHKIEDRLQET